MKRGARGTTPRCAMLHHAVPCCAAPCHAVLHHAVPCCTTLCHAMLCRAALCCSSQHCTVPCSAAPRCAVPFCTAPRCAVLCQAALHHATQCCFVLCCAAPFCTALCHHAVPCHAALLHAVPCHAVPCCTRQGAPQYLELWCPCTLHGTPVPEPLVLRRRVADGSALQQQRVPLSQAARLWLPQDLQPRHGGAVTAGWGGDRQQV